MNPILKRTLTGATVLIVVVTAYVVDRHAVFEQGLPAWCLSGLTVLVTLGALGELLRIGGAKPGRRKVGLAMGVLWLTLLILAGTRATPGWTAVGDVLTAASGMTAVFLAIQVRHGPSPVSHRLAGSLWFQVPYVGGLACLILPLLGGRIDFVIGVVLVAKSSDVAAYFAGKFLGKHKLAPKVSPGKTIEGAVGGLIGPALVACWLLSGVELVDGRFLPEAPLVALVGVVIAVLTIVSDLSESLLKRSRDVKDSGTLFGDSGGFLDLSDSLLLVGPFAVAYTAIVA